MEKKWKARHESYTETINYIKARKAGKIKSLKTPWKSLNEAALDGIQWGDALLMAARPGIGKAQPLNSLIYTPTGYVTMGDVKIGTRILNENGGISKVIGVYPQGKKSVYRLYFTDGTAADCCENHLWKVITQKGRKAIKDKRYNDKSDDFDKERWHSVIETKDIISKFVPGIILKNAPHFKLPLPKAVNFNKQKIELDPYLMGLILGDGGISQQTVSITTIDKETVDFLKKHVKDNYPNMHIRKDDKITYYLSRDGYSSKNKNTVIEVIKKYGLMGKNSKTKFIPKQFIYNSISVRIAILQGLLDTDGYINAMGTIIYTSASNQLAQDVIELVRSLGWIAKLSSKFNKKYQSYSWNVTISYDDSFIPFRLKRKVKRLRKVFKMKFQKYICGYEILPAQEQQCIMVDSPTHLYLTNGYNVTHNTIWGDQLINESFTLNPGQRFRVLKFEWEMWDVVSVIRELSSHIGKSFQYVCSAGNIESEGQVTDTEIKQFIDYLAKKVEKDKEGQLKYPIDVVSQTMTVKEFEKTCQEYAETYPDDDILVLVDHIRLADLDSDEKDERAMLQNMSKAVIRQKKAKRPNKMTFILLTHLNREVTKADRCEEGSVANYMVESDIFGSDSMSQACEIIMAWDRPSKRQIRFYGPPMFIIEDRTLISQNIKVRNGETGMTFYEGKYEEMKIVEIPAPSRASKKSEYKKSKEHEIEPQTSMNLNT